MANVVISTGVGSGTPATLLDHSVLRYFIFAWDESVDGFAYNDLTITVDGGTFNIFDTTFFRYSGNNWRVGFFLPSLGGGTVTVTVREDAVTQGNDETTATFNWGDGPAGIPVTLTANPSSTYPNQTVTITAEFDQSVTGLLLSDFSTSAGTLSNLQGSGTTWTVDLALPATGTGTATVTLAADAVTVGGLGNVEATVDVDYDPQVPTLTAASASGFNGQDIELTVTFPATPTGFALGDLSTTGGTLSNLTVDPTDDKIYTVDLTLPTSGTGSATVTLAANSVQPPNAAATVTVSHEPVSAITITPSETSGYNSEVVNFATLFPVAVTNFVIGDLATTAGTLSNLQGSGTTWTFDLTLPASGTGTAVVSLPAGTVTPLNALATAAGVSYGPITPVITPSASAGYNGQVIEVHIVFPTTPTGFVIGDLDTTAGTLSNLQGSGTAWTADLTLPASGTGTATVSIPAGSVTPNNAAASGNVNYEPITATITPSVATVLIATNFTFNVQLNYAVTGIDTADFSVDNGTIEDVTGSGDYWEVEVTAPATGAGTITITMRANAAAEGSASATGSTEWIAEDPDAPVIDMVAEQNILVDTNYQLRVGITNEPEEAYAIGELEGYSTDWNAGDTQIIIKGRPDRLVSGKRYTIFAKKGEFERQREVIYSVIPTSPLIEDFGPFTAFKRIPFSEEILIRNNPSTVIATGPWVGLRADKSENGAIVSGVPPDQDFTIDMENIRVIASNAGGENMREGVINISTDIPLFLVNVVSSSEPFDYRISLVQSEVENNMVADFYTETSVDSQYSLFSLASHNNKFYSLFGNTPNILVFGVEQLTGSGIEPETTVEIQNFGTTVIPIFMEVDENFFYVIYRDALDNEYLYKTFDRDNPSSQASSRTFFNQELQGLARDPANDDIYIARSRFGNSSNRILVYSVSSTNGGISSNSDRHIDLPVTPFNGSGIDLLIMGDYLYILRSGVIYRILKNTAEDETATIERMFTPPTEIVAVRGFAFLR